MQNGTNAYLCPTHLNISQTVNGERMNIIHKINNKFLIFVIITVLVIVISFIVYCVFYAIKSNYDQEIVKTEYYITYDDNCKYKNLKISYQRDGSILYSLKTYKDTGEILYCISSGADFINSNTAISDGSNFFPPISDLYYEFIFRDGIIDFYSSEEFEATYYLVKE